jgi:dihydroneopterin aldolase
MQGTIGISDLKVNCIIGIYPHERKVNQDLFLDITIKYDFQNARKTENVNDTIDYANLAEMVTNLGIKKQYQLIETFAEDAADLVLNNFSVNEISIKIKKPGAIKNAAYPFVEITRKKSWQKNML